MFLLIWSWVHWDEKHISLSCYGHCHLSFARSLALGFNRSRNKKILRKLLWRMKNYYLINRTDTRAEKKAYDLFLFYVILRWHGLCKCYNKCHLCWREEPSNWYFHMDDSVWIRWQFSWPISAFAFAESVFLLPTNAILRALYITQRYIKFIAVLKHERGCVCVCVLPLWNSNFIQ